MWFEILPSFIIIVAFMGCPHFISYPINNWVVGNEYRRRTERQYDRLTYLRDKRLTGNPYSIAGLDNIPDDTEGGDDNGGGSDEDNADAGAENTTKYAEGIQQGSACPPQKMSMVASEETDMHLVIEYGEAKM